ncbi:MAG: type II CAAX endopeptidase family protein [Dehalococcoidia bacterium]
MFQDDPPGPPPLEAPPSRPTAAPIEAGVRWRGVDLVLGVALLLLGTVGVMAALLLSPRGEVGDLDGGGVPLVAVIVTLVFELWMGVAVLLLAVMRRVPLRDLGFWRLPRWDRVVQALLGAYGVLIAYTFGLQLVQQWTGRDLSQFAEGNSLPMPEQEAFLVWGVLGVAVVLAAPVAEELFFRGLVFRAVAGIWRVLPAVVISGVAFSLVHFNISVVLPFAVIGMIFAWAYRASGSLWTPIAAHAIFNGVSFVATVVQVQS